MSAVCASVGACTQELLAAAVSSGASGSRLLLVSFTDVGGLTMALNWALHLRRVGVTPVVGLDGQMPSKWGSASEEAAWRSVRPVLFSAGASAARNGYQRWRLRWDVVGQLLALGTDVMMSDTDVVWLRDPRPYVRALITRHPLLDVLLGTDHALYAEALQEEVSYTSRASPTRRDVIGALQTVHSSPEHSSPDLGVSPDFDLDPMPANGALDGTWNPGMLLARASAGGAAFVLSLLDALEAEARRHRKAPRIRLRKHGVVEKELMVGHTGLEPRTSRQQVPGEVLFCYSHVWALRWTGVGPEPHVRDAAAGAAVRSRHRPNLLGARPPDRGPRTATRAAAAARHRPPRTTRGRACTLQGGHRLSAARRRRARAAARRRRWRRRRRARAAAGGGTRCDQREQWRGKGSAALSLGRGKGQPAARQGGAR
jgi:hypothetical protein